MMEVNAIEQEQLDFITAIRTGTLPQVTGSDGLQALIVAEQILQKVANHHWDGATGSRSGPLATAHALESEDPHDRWSTDDTVIIHRKAG